MSEGIKDLWKDEDPKIKKAASVLLLHTILSEYVDSVKIRGINFATATEVMGELVDNLSDEEQERAIGLVEAELKRPDKEAAALFKAVFGDSKLVAGVNPVAEPSATHVVDQFGTTVDDLGTFKGRTASGLAITDRDDWLKEQIKRNEQTNAREKEQ